MTNYEMTYIQYCENWLNNNKYKEAYKADPTKWENKKNDLKLEWVNILHERAEEGSIPEVVIRAYVKMFGEEQTRRTFRGVKEKGLQDWNETQIKKQSRESLKENMHKSEEICKTLKRA